MLVVSAIWQYLLLRCRASFQKHSAPFSSRFKPTLICRDVLMVQQVHAYKACGGGAIVDVTTIGIRPADPTLVRSISEDTGVHIVQGTGYYLRMAHVCH